MAKKAAPKDKATPHYKWTCVTLNAPYAPRDGAGIVAMNGRMWMLGGWNPGDKVHFPKICNSEVWSTSDGLDWRLDVPQAPWEGRHTAGYVVHQGRMWIVGGDCNQGHYQKDVWSSADGVHWDLVTDSVPWFPRALHHTVAYNGRIWIMGGQTIPPFVEGPELFYNDVWCSTDGASWQRVSEHAPWTPRGMVGGSAVHNGRMWLLGGGTYDTPQVPVRKFFNEVWSTADGVNWRLDAAQPAWPPREYHDVAVFDGRMWVLEGGTMAGNRKDVWHSPDGVHWQELPDTPWAPRHAAGLVVFNNSLWIIGGNNMTPDVWKLTRAGD